MISPGHHEFTQYIAQQAQFQSRMIIKYQVHTSSLQGHFY